MGKVGDWIPHSPHTSISPQLPHELDISWVRQGNSHISDWFEPLSTSYWTIFWFPATPHQAEVRPIYATNSAAGFPRGHLWAKKIKTKTKVPCNLDTKPFLRHFIHHHHGTNALQGQCISPKVFHVLSSGSLLLAMTAGVHSVGHDPTCWMDPRRHGQDRKPKGFLGVVSGEIPSGLRLGPLWSFPFEKCPIPCDGGHSSPVWTPCRPDNSRNHRKCCWLLRVTVLEFRLFFDQFCFWPLYFAFYIFFIILIFQFYIFFKLKFP